MSQMKILEAFGLKVLIKMEFFLKDSTSNVNINFNIKII